METLGNRIETAAHEFREMFLHIIELPNSKSLLVKDENWHFINTFQGLFQYFRPLGIYKKARNSDRFYVSFQF